jgi:hypothetical protein
MAGSVDAATARVEAMRGTLSDARLRWVPPEGGWSISHVFEHLCMAHADYLEMMARVIERARAEHAARDAPIAPGPGSDWRPSLFGWLLVKSFESKRKMTAPRMWANPEPRANVVGEFLEQQRRLRELLDAATKLHWKRVGTSSPVSKFIRLNIGDCFVILATHAERHLRQIDRIASHPQFPPS